MKPFFVSVVGRIISPVLNNMAKARCRECEPFIKKGFRVLDLGCGTGIVGLAIKNYFQAEVLGADVADQRTVDIPFQLINGKTLPFPDNSFDVVYIAHVLHHTKNHLDLLKESKRISKNKIIIYEDLPEGYLSNLFCQIHGFLFNIIGMFNREKTYFKQEERWMEIFNSLGLQVVRKEKLKVNSFYPIRYIQFVLTKGDSEYKVN